MMRFFHRWTAIAALVLLTVGRSHAAPPADAAPPTDAEKPGDAGPSLPQPKGVDDRPAPFVLPPPDYQMTQPESGPSLLLDRPDVAPVTALFVNVEADVVRPNFQNQLLGGQALLDRQDGASVRSSIGLPPGQGLPITGDVIQFPGNKLNPTVSPLIQLGYRLSDGMGEFRLDYRCVDSRGSDVIPTEFGAAAQTGRLAVNEVDLDWASREFSLGPNWEMRTAFGVRYTSIYIDSQVTYLNPVFVTDPFGYGTGPFTRLSQTEVVFDMLVGPHVELEVDRKLPIPGLAVFGRLEGASLVGYPWQTFKEVLAQPPYFNEIRVRNTLEVPTLEVQVGVSYDVPQWNHSRFLIGYLNEVWFDAGRGNDDQSDGRLYYQGLMLRAEINF